MTNELLEDLIEEQRKTNTLLLTLLETIEQGGMVNQKAGSSPSGRKGYQAHLGVEEKQALDDEVDLDWWFVNYGEEALPAKYMHAFSATGEDVDSLYTKDEGDYIFHRIKDYLDEKNEQGTHVFKFLGKVWCKREGNARNCFAFIPLKESTHECSAP